jgi:hypothetical protein
MIKNDKQYQITKRKLKEFTDALIDIENQKDLEPLLLSLHLNALKAQIQQLEDEIREFELLKAGEIKVLIINSPSEFSEALIKARISLGWSQAELAERLDLKEQQIQRYEACNYSTATFPKMLQVAGILGLRFPSTKVRIQESHLNVSPGVIAKASCVKSKLGRNKSLLSIG